MKTKLFYAIVFLMFVHIANGQTFGIKGGVNFANVAVSGSGTSSPKSITEIHVGPVADFVLQKNLSINTGLLFSIKGAKSEDSYNGTTYTNKTTLNYLEVPINLAYKFPINDKTKFLIEAGPYVGYALSGKDKASDGTTDIKFGGQDGIKRFDLGLGFGAGVELGSIVFSLNYELGLTNLIDDSSVSSKNRVFQVSLAYMFGAKK